MQVVVTSKYVRRVQDKHTSRTIKATLDIRLVYLVLPWDNPSNRTTFILPADNVEFTVS